MSTEAEVLREIRAIMDNYNPATNRKTTLFNIQSLLDSTKCGLPDYVDPDPPKTIRTLQAMMLETARKTGWHDGPERSFGEYIALFHSELSEAWEEFRNHHKFREIYFNPDTGSKPEGIPIELADCVIRILDFCGRYGIDLEEAILLKASYNATRPYRHGGKAA